VSGGWCLARPHEIALAELRTTGLLDMEMRRSAALTFEPSNGEGAHTGHVPVARTRPGGDHYLIRLSRLFATPGYNSDKYHRLLPATRYALNSILNCSNSPATSSATDKSVSHSAMISYS
jgi:hypothetical protein